MGNEEAAFLGARRFYFSVCELKLRWNSSSSSIGFRTCRLWSHVTLVVHNEMNSVSSPLWFILKSYVMVKYSIGAELTKLCQPYKQHTKVNSSSETITVLSIPAIIFLGQEEWLPIPRYQNLKPNFPNLLAINKAASYNCI